MGIDIVICCAPADLALAQVLARALGDAGHRAHVSHGTGLPRSPQAVALWLWTAQSAASPKAVRAASDLPQRGLDVGVAGTVPPPSLMGHGHLAWDGTEAGAAKVVAAVRAWLSPPPVQAAAPSRLRDRFFGTAPPAAPRQQAQWQMQAPPEPVLLAAAAPRTAAAGSSFTASLVAYIDAARDSALRKLEQLGEAGDRVVSDLAPDAEARWAVGAPVSVRLAGPHFSVAPAERRFDWNGCENLASFAVTVNADAPAGSVGLCFQVAVAGVAMAFIPLRIGLGAAAPAAEPQRSEATLPQSVFASYSSKDAPAVTQRLSTLLRWSPGLDIFQDCLDLVPNEAFKPQLAAQIGARDAFLLFWSRHAAASPWVRWEYETARDGNGLQAILPMPLEDPAIAPPPAEFAGAHLRDRFMLAGYALAAIREQAAKP